jgi:predicted TIM-barrel fold metal-dependent hydrolase
VTATDALPILDTHQHLIYSDRWSYGWTAQIPALAGKAFTYADYLAAARDTGIVATRFMESAPDDPHWRSETRFMAELAAKEGSLIGGLVANCRPEDETFRAWLDEIAALPIAGLRRILHVEPDELSQQPGFIENVRRLAARRWTFDLCLLQRQLPLGVALAQECPAVQFVLDHCGVPDIAGGAVDDWKRKINQLAALPNIACKISGVMAYCPPAAATLAAVRPYVEHCIEAFGWDRVVWGSDWPVCLIGASLRQWVEVTRAIIVGEDVVNQRKLLFDNAARIYAIG